MGQPLPQALSNYMNYSSNSEVNKVCQPLKKINISFFLFARYYKDSSQTWLTNNRDWETHFYEQQLYRSDCLRAEELNKNYRFYLWKCMPCQNVFDAARNFDIDHGITLIEHHEDYHDTWHFGTTPNNRAIYDLYINKVNLLERFTHYFRSEAHSLIEAADFNRLHESVIEGHNHNPNTALIMLDEPDFSAFIKETHLNRLYLSSDHGDSYLTARELDCIRWLQRGKSVDEIAMIMDRSTSTVQTHIENIKKKFDCYKQFTLGYNIAKINVFTD